MNSKGFSASTSIYKTKNNVFLNICYVIAYKKKKKMEVSSSPQQFLQFPERWYLNMSIIIPGISACHHAPHGKLWSGRYLKSLSLMILSDGYFRAWKMVKLEWRGNKHFKLDLILIFTSYGLSNKITVQIPPYPQMVLP